MRLSLVHNKAISPTPTPTLPIPKPHVTPSLHPTPSPSTQLSDPLIYKRLSSRIPRHSHPYSPKNWDSFLYHPAQIPTRLGRKWADYQGADNWDGLLNPLDDSLRSEILRYGSFVEAAYRSFNFNPSSSSYASCQFSKKELLTRSGSPKTGYKVTKNLRATSGIQMPRWTEKAASWAAVQSSWIGYVAVCTEKSEIQRLGRRDVVIAFRGTATCLEWLENLRATLTPLDGGDGSMVESGFLSLYTSGTATCPSLQDTLRREIKRILETYKGEEVSFTLTGHSLGAALATLAAHDIKKEFKERAPRVTVMSFGGPRVGNGRFRCHVEKQGIKVLRIVNPGDVVTKMPGFVVEEEEEVAGWGWWWLQRRVEETRWGYAEVGRELRLTSAGRDEEEKLPFYLGNMNLAKCHDLKTYLSLVGSSVGSNCPIRETAHRFLKKDRA